jgi:integrase/recombinase XerC
MPLLDPLTRQVLMIMKPLDLDKITNGVSPVWAGFLRDWDRSLRAGNYPATTRYNYLLAAAQLGRYLAEHSPDPDADADAGAGAGAGEEEIDRSPMDRVRQPKTRRN